MAQVRTPTGAVPAINAPVSAPARDPDAGAHTRPAQAPLLLGPILAGLLAWILPAVETTEGTSLRLSEVSDELTLANFGWAPTLFWAALTLTLACGLFFPRSERFIQTIAVTFFSLVACVFPYVVNRQLHIVEGDRIGSGLIAATALLVLTLVSAWLRAFWWDPVRPHPFGHDWTKWLFLLPAIIWVLALTLFPVVYAFTTSRYFFRSGRISRFVGWENFERLFAFGDSGKDFLLAGIAAAVAVALLMAVGLALSWFSDREITRDDVRRLAGFIPLVTIPVMLFVLAPRVLSDPVGDQLYITMIFAAASVSIEMVLGFALALLMNREIRLRGIWRAIITLPIFATPVAIGYLFRTILYEEGGPMNAVLENFGVSPPWLSDPNWARASTILVDVWQWTPFVFIIALAGLQGLPTDVLEASRVDGATSWQVLRTMIVPLMAPILWLIVLLRMIDAFKAFDVAIALTIGGPGRATEYYSLFNYRTARQFFNYGEASAQAFLLLVVVMTLVTLLWGRIRHIYEDEGVRA